MVSLRVHFGYEDSHCTSLDVLTFLYMMSIDLAAAFIRFQKRMIRQTGGSPADLLDDMETKMMFFGG